MPNELDRTIKPAAIWKPWELDSIPVPPAGEITGATFYEAGTPFVIDTDGLAVEADREADGFVSLLQTVIWGLYGLSAEPFDGTYYTAGSVPLRVTKISMDQLAPHCFIDANLYEDGEGGAGEIIQQTHLGQWVGLQKLASGVYVWNAEDFNAETDMPFYIWRLVDKVGTINGRMLGMPSLGFTPSGYFPGIIPPDIQE